MARIQGLEFVEMNKMLPESWIPGIQDASLALQMPSCRDFTTDNLAWTECFAFFAAVITEKFLDKAPQLFAYLCRIIHAAQSMFTKVSSFISGVSRIIND